MNNLKFIGIAITTCVIFAGSAIAWNVIVPGDEPVLTEKYDLKTMERLKAYYGKNQPFLLSKTTLLWCNDSLVNFPSAGTIVKIDASLDRNDAEVVVCK